MGEKLNLCLGCMNELNENGICEVCEYVEGSMYLPSYLAPKTILNDRYFVGKLLTYNGEGATYIAYDLVTNEKVYVREFMPDALCSRVRDSGMIEVNSKKIVQFKNCMAEFVELHKTLSKMRTISHISPTLDTFYQNNTAYAVIEYVDGITLKEYLKENAGELTWQEVKKLFPPVFTTLSLVHNAGIVHRGISLDTIYYTNKGELKLTGFCISESRTANTELAPEFFSGFAAPEQYSSGNWHGTWTDVYAVSALLYRVLTGCLPNDAVSRIGNDSLTEPAEINPNIPSNVSKVIMSGMKLNGDLRIQTITEFVTKLFEQPDYMEETRSNTSTIIIPRLTGNENIMESSSGGNMNNKKMMLLVASTTLVFLLLFATIILLIVLKNNNSEQAVDNSVFDSSVISDSLIDTQTEPIESTESTTTTEESSSVIDVETILTPDLVGSNFEISSSSEGLREWVELIPTYEYNEEYPSGKIFEQDIVVGKEIPAGTVMNVKVSKGSQYAIVPSFEGLSEQDYLVKLDNLNIKYDTRTFDTDEVMNGYVVKISKSVDDRINLKENEVLIVYIAVNSNSDDT